MSVVWQYPFLLLFCFWISYVGVYLPCIRQKKLSHGICAIDELGGVVVSWTILTILARLVTGRLMGETDRDKVAWSCHSIVGTWRRDLLRCYEKWTEDLYYRADLCIVVNLISSQDRQVD